MALFYIVANCLNVGVLLSVLSPICWDITRHVASGKLHRTLKSKWEEQEDGKDKKRLRLMKMALTSQTWRRPRSPRGPTTVWELPSTVGMSQVLSDSSSTYWYKFCITCHISALEEPTHLYF